MPANPNDPRWFEAYKGRMRFRCKGSPTLGTCCLCGGSDFGFDPCPENMTGQDAGLHCPHWVDEPHAAEEVDVDRA